MDKIYELLKMIGAVILGVATIVGLIFGTVFVPLSQGLESERSRACGAEAGICVQLTTAIKDLSDKCDRYHDEDMKAREVLVGSVAQIKGKLGIEK